MIKTIAIIRDKYDSYAELPRVNLIFRKLLSIKKLCGDALFCAAGLFGLFEVFLDFF